MVASGCCLMVWLVREVRASDVGCMRCSVLGCRLDVFGLSVSESCRDMRALGRRSVFRTLVSSE